MQIRCPKIACHCGTKHICKSKFAKRPILGPHGSDRLLGNQICYWTTGSAKTCMKVTYLVVFLPPALGTYVLSQHHTKVSSSLSSADDVSMLDKPHTLRINQSSLLTPPVVVKHQAEQIANTRRRAAEGSLPPYTIPLLANTQTRSSKNRVTWTLKFTRGMAQAGHMPLKGRCVMLTPSTTNTKPPHFCLTSPFVTQYGPARPGSNSWVAHPRIHQSMASLRCTPHL